MFVAPFFPSMCNVNNNYKKRVKISDLGRHCLFSTRHIFADDVMLTNQHLLMCNNAKQELSNVTKHGPCTRRTLIKVNGHRKYITQANARAYVDQNADSVFVHILFTNYFSIQSPCCNAYGAGLVNKGSRVRIPQFNLSLSQLNMNKTIFHQNQTVIFINVF